jgi:hypothetical protein
VRERGQPQRVLPRLVGNAHLDTSNEGGMPVVVGVIDGLRARTAETHPAAALTLRSNETLEIRGADGAPLLAIVPTPAGPVLRLTRADQRLEVDGRLAFAADAITFVARGEVSLSAGGDVIVTGEEIKLN